MIEQAFSKQLRGDNAMAYFERDDIRLYYEEHGSGYPLLLFAPGGLKSAVELWQNSPWNPIVELAPHFRVIAMDQRNAGRSTAPVKDGDGWHTFAHDHIALLDHLRIDKTLLLGGCIGGPYCLGVMEAAPARVAAAVLQQPIGATNENQSLFYDLFNGWAEEVRPRLPAVEDAAWTHFRSNMFDGDFVYNVSRDFVSACQTPMLVLMGNDDYHPAEISREIVRLAPNATLIENWKSPQRDRTVERVVEFLLEHSRA